MKVKTSLYLDKELYERFCAFAKKNRRSASAQLELLMEQAIEEREKKFLNVVKNECKLVIMR